MGKEEDVAILRVRGVFVWSFGAGFVVGVRGFGVKIGVYSQTTWSEGPRMGEPRREWISA